MYVHIISIRYNVDLLLMRNEVVHQVYSGEKGNLEGAVKYTYEGLSVAKLVNRRHKKKLNIPKEEVHSKMKFLQILSVLARYYA